MRTILRNIAGAAAVVLATLFMPTDLRSTDSMSNVRAAMADELAVSQPAWTVADLKGSAKSRSAGAASAVEWIQLDSGMRLPPGAEIATGADGFVELFNGKDRVQVMANSHVQLPIAEQSNLLVRVLHQLGTVFFEVGKQPGRRFEVDTPYLVAIVKGTKFSTQVTDGGGWVNVTEGVVGVSASSSSVSVDVTVGQTATVAAGAEGGVQVGPTSSSGAPATSAPGSTPESPASTTSPSSPASPTDSTSSSGSGNQSSSGGEGKGHGNGKGNEKGNGNGNGNGGQGCGKGNCNGHGKHSAKMSAISRTFSSNGAPIQFTRQLNGRIATQSLSDWTIPA
ncbi:MAG: FecR domain-containing protein [Dongiaceae bacterium]